MKRAFLMLFAAVSLLPAQCLLTFSLGSQVRSKVLDNRSAHCTNWTLKFTISGTSTVSVELDSASYQQGPWSLFTGTSVRTVSGTVSAAGSPSFVSVYRTAGYGVISGTLSGTPAGTASAVTPESIGAVSISGTYDNPDWLIGVDWSKLKNVPTLGTGGDQVQTDWSAVSGLGQILNKPTLATVATSGSFNDLLNKPSIPSAQVQSDWNAGSGMGQILNKPALGGAALLNVGSSAGTVAAGNHGHSGYEATITAGTSSQVWLGNKTWATLNTALVPESGGNLYFTNALARLALSSTAPISYDSSTGIISCPTCGGTGGIPYTGASQSVDLGAFSLKATSLEATGSIFNLQIKQGTCATVDTANSFTHVICMESGVLYKVDSVGTKTQLVPAGPTVIANGTAVLGTSAINSGACATAVAVTATGVVATDVISFIPNADVTAVTGYAPTTAGGLAIYPYPTAGYVNFKACNPTSASITPGAVTLNWMVTR